MSMLAANIPSPALYLPPSSGGWDFMAFRSDDREQLEVRWPLVPESIRS